MIVVCKVERANLRRIHAEAIEQCDGRAITRSPRSLVGG